LSSLSSFYLLSDTVFIPLSGYETAQDITFFASTQQDRNQQSI